MIGVRAAIFAVAVLLPTAALAGTLTVHPISSAQTPVTYVDGYEGLTSAQTQSSVALLAGASTQDAKDLPVFVLFVRNEGVQSFNLTEASVTVTDQLGRALHVLTREEIIAAAAKEAGRQRFWAKVGAMGGIIASNGAAGASASGQRQIAATTQAGEAGKSAARDLAFVRDTVIPEETSDTLVHLERLPKDVTQIKFSIQTGENIHQFSFSVSRD
jgi:hypothetical protein